MVGDDIKNYELDYRDKSESKIASFLFFLSWVIFIIGFIAPFIPRADHSHAPFLTTIFAFTLVGAFFRGIAEIIKLLHSINNKLK